MSDDTNYLKLSDKIISLLDKEKPPMPDALMAIGIVIGFIAYYRKEDLSLDNIIDIIVNVVREQAANIEKALGPRVSSKH